MIKEIVFRDMRIRCQEDTSFESVLQDCWDCDCGTFHLTEGRAPGGYCHFNDHEGFRLYVSRLFTEPEQATILFHELVHRHLISDRYADINRREDERFDRREFHELIARCAERRFIEAGGMKVRKEAMPVYV